MTEDEIIALLSGGQGYQQYDGSTPYGRTRNRIALLKDIQGQTGFNLFKPAEIPEDKSLQFRTVYGTDPSFAKAFDAIDAGSNPVAVRQAYGEDVAAGTVAGGLDPEAFDKIVSDYAFARANREGGSTEPETYYEKMGSPTLEDAREMVVQNRMAGARRPAPTGRGLVDIPVALLADQSARKEATGGKYANPVYRKALDEAISDRLGRATRTRNPDAQSADTVRRIMAMRAMLGQS